MVNDMIPTDLIQDLPLAPLFGAAGLAGQVAWPMLRDRQHILAAQLGIACCYATQYALMGQGTGMAVCLVGATQTTIALIAGDRPWLSRTGLVFVPLVLALAVVTWSGLPTLLAASACTLIMLGRMQRDILRMRAVMLCAAPFGIAYDLSVGAVPALIGAVLSLALSALAFRRALQDRTRAQGARAAA